jgi:hypothetical protein
MSEKFTSAIFPKSVVKLYSTLRGVSHLGRDRRRLWSPTCPILRKLVVKNFLPFLIIVACEDTRHCFN